LSAWLSTQRELLAACFGRKREHD
jgi:hypothetical protein